MVSNLFNNQLGAWLEKSWSFLPELVLVLGQHGQRLLENGPDRATAHLDPQVLAVEEGSG
jgi:hypothetical protein